MSPFSLMRRGFFWQWLPSDSPVDGPLILPANGHRYWVAGGVGVILWKFCHDRRLMADAGDNFKNRASIPLAPCILFYSNPPLSSSPAAPAEGPWRILLQLRWRRAWASPGPAPDRSPRSDSPCPQLSADLKGHRKGRSVVVVWIFLDPDPDFYCSAHCNEIPFWELHGPSPNFHIHVPVSDLYIYFQDRSTYFPAAEYANQSGRNIYVNGSQTHENGNWDCVRAILFLEICFEFFVLCLCSAFCRVWTQIHLRLLHMSLNMIFRVRDQDSIKKNHRHVYKNTRIEQFREAFSEDTGRFSWESINDNMDAV